MDVDCNICHFLSWGGDSHLYYLHTSSRLNKSTEVTSVPYNKRVSCFWLTIKIYNKEIITRVTTISQTLLSLQSTAWGTVWTSTYNCMQWWMGCGQNGKGTFYLGIHVAKLWICVAKLGKSVAELRIYVAKLRMCVVEFGTVVAMLSASKLRRQLPISITRIFQNCRESALTIVFQLIFTPLKKKRLLGLLTH